MPSQAVAFYGSIGVNPPANPSATSLWLSQSLKDQRFSPSPADRAPVLTAGVAWEQGVVQEPNVWFYNGRFHMIFSGGSPNAGLGYAYADKPDGPWTKYAGNPVLGQGAGGWADKAFHSQVFVDGATLYCYFPDVTNNLMKVATASIDDPTTWVVQGTVMSLPSGATQWGNTSTLKDGATYYMLYEALESGWQMGLATATSPLGPFTSIHFRMQNLWPGGKQFTGSGPNLFKEGSTYVLYYHSGPYSNNTFPTDGYRAFSTDLINWTIDLNSQPIVSRAAPQEIDQVADLCLVQDSGERWWAFWTGYDNQTPTASIMGSVLRPTMKSWGGRDWYPIVDRGDAYPPKGYTLETPFNLVVMQNTNYTASHRDDVAMDATSASRTVTLPRATTGSIARVAHVGTGAFTVTIAVNGAGSDSITATNTPLAAGTQATFRCYVAGKWIRQG